MADQMKLVKLLQGLIDATTLGRIVWEETYDGSGFRVVTEHGMVRIGGDWDDDREEGTLVVTLMDRKARVADEFRLTEKQDSGPGSAYPIALQLSNIARRSARASEGLLDRMIADVDTLKA